MSHNYPYRRPPSDTDLRPDPGSYRSVDYRLSSADRDFYRQPQESFATSASTSYTSSSSSRGSAPLQSSQEGVLNILSSCGLEPGDLALLAELPEDVLTVESLPHILRQIKCKKGNVKRFSSRAPSPPASSSYPPSSTHRPATSSSSRDWDQFNCTSVQYPLDHLPPPHPPSEQLLDRWGNPITVSSSRADPLPSSSSSSSLGYTVDFHRRQGSSEYGKTGPVPSYSAARREGAPPSRYSEAGPPDYRAPVVAPPPSNEYQSKSHASRRDTSSTGSSQSSAAMPTRKEALDFHGKVPLVFPYSCSLCDITVLSQKVWIQHVSGTQHADGQLSLLQQFPNWDCRMQTIRRDDKSEKKKQDGGRAAAAAAANQTASQSNRKSKQKKTLEKGKVVCAKFPSSSVDETYLRKLTEPFGKIVKILMFPSLGFVEMGSVDQAKDLVKFHSNYPPTVNGDQIEFSISNAFNFLQSSRVLSFTPAPSGEHGKSDLISIVKRFGPPLYTLFLPSMAFVEMKNAPDAQKLMDYYQSNTLRLNDDLISVSFSGEYKTLMRVSKAKRYEEDDECTKKSSTKRARSSSRDRDKSKENKKRRSRSRDRSSKDERARTRSRSKDKSKEKSSSEAKTTSRSQEKSDRKRKSRTRSRSKDKSYREKRTRSKSGSRDRTKEKPTRERKTKSQEKKRGNRSRSRDKSREKSNKDQKIRSSKESKTRSTTSKDRKSRSRSRSTDKSSRDQKSRPRQRSTSMSSRQDGEKTADPEKPDAGSSSKDQPAPPKDSKPEVLDKQQVEEEAALPGEESDIEGMEVIAEDGENLEHDDVEALQEEEKITSPAEMAPEKDEAEEATGGEPDSQENPVTAEGEMKEEEEEEESKEATETREESEDFPVDLENCITLDELGEDESDDPGAESAGEPKSASRSSRVFYFYHLPAHYALFDFFKLLRNFGRVVRYYLIGNRREGFIEMSSSSAALKAVKELTSNPAIHNCPKLTARISAKYYRLDNGWLVHSDGSDNEKNRSSSKKNEKQGKSKTSDRDEDDRRSKGRKESLKKTEKSGKKTPEKEAASKKTPERESSGIKTLKKEKDPKNTLENKSRKTPEKDLLSKKTLDKDSVAASKETPEKTSCSGKSLEKSTSKKTPEKQSESKNSSQGESSDKQTPEQDLKNRSEKESAGRVTPEKAPPYDKIPENKTVEPKGTPENDSVLLTTLKTEPEEENIQKNEELVAREGPEEEKGPAEDHCRKKTPKAEKQEEQETSMEVCAEVGPDVEDAERPNPPDASAEPSKAPGFQAGCSSSEILDSSERPRENIGVKLSYQFSVIEKIYQEVEPQAGPAEGAAEPQKPTKPVGTEFVRPVVGYFCNLCQLIFADEDEAKQQHCSSLTHYSKYQEKTGFDPWTS